MAHQQQLTPEPQRTSSGTQRYDEQTLRQAIQLADRLQAEHKDRYSASDIEKIAAEIGVQPEFVHKALNEIEDKHEAETIKKTVPPPVSQQVAQVAQQAGAAAKTTAGTILQKIQRRLDEASVEQMKNYVGMWWGTAWALMPLADGLSGNLEDAFVPMAVVTYIGFGIYLGKRLQVKQIEQRLLQKAPLSAKAGAAPPVRYSVETSGVSRDELLAQMIEIQKRLEGERVRRAFLSIDVVSSSEMKRSADELLVEYSFNRYRQFVEEIVLSEGGQVQSSAGDGTMAMFPSDAAAVRAALRLQESMAAFNASHNRLPRPFHIRCGINAGEVALIPGTPIGHLQSAVIDRAAALQKSAAPDDIIVSGDLSTEGLAALGRYGRHAESPEGGVRGFSWRSGF